MAIAPAVAAAMAEIDPAIPIAEVQPMSAFVARARGPMTFATTVIGACSVCA